MRFDPASQREKAAALARALEPLIFSHLSSERTPAPVVMRADAALVDAAVLVATAVTKLEQAKFTSGEIRARGALERAAAQLRTQIKQRRERPDVS